MTKKTKTNLSKPKQTRAIVKKKEEKKLLWLGAQRLMQKPENEKENKERRLILLTARVLGVSPFGVNILGNLPYINQIGLKQKAEQYGGKDIMFKYEWIKYSNDDTDKAICRCKIVKGNKDLTDWVVGECSPSSMKMGTLKGYQNHMAQTRARNRAILEAFGIRIHEEMLKNIEKLYQQKEITAKEADKASTAAITSAEEVEQNSPQVQKSLFAESNEVEKLLQLARELGAEEGAEKKFIVQVTGIQPDWENLTKKQIDILKAELLSKKVKK